MHILQEKIQIKMPINSKIMTYGERGMKVGSRDEREEVNI